MEISLPLAVGLVITVYVLSRLWLDWRERRRHDAETRDETRDEDERNES
jgi:hypothetical protein